jgi:hypothetical protein
MTTATDYLFEKTLNLLSNKERKGFEPWLNGTLGRSKPKLQAMYRYWEEGNDWEVIADKLGFTPDTAQTQRKLTRLRGELQEQVELYLSWLGFQQDKYLQRRILLRELINRNAVYHFPIIRKKYQSAREGGTLRNQSYFEAAFWEETMQQTFLVKYPPNFRRDEHLVDTRMAHWLIWKEFELLELGLAAENIRAPEREITQRLAAVWKEVVPEPPESLQLVRDIHDLYQQQAWRRKTPERDQALIEQFKALYPCFDQHEVANLYVLIFNYLLRKAKYLPDPAPPHVALDLCQWGLTMEILPINRPIYRTVANLMGNIIVLTEATTEKRRLGEEAMHFLNTHLDQLSENERKMAFQYNRAVIQFALGNYDDMWIDLNESAFRDPYYELGYEMLLLKADIEMQREEGIGEELHRLKRKVERAPGTSDLTKQGYLHQLTLIRALLKIETQSEAEQLLERIKATHPLEGRVWLNQKVKALIE